MDPRTTEFIVFCVFNAGSLAAGYTARRRGWMPESASRLIHLVTVAVLWSGVSVLTLWKLPPASSNLWLVGIEPVLVGLPAVLMIGAARAVGCTRPEAGALAIGAGLGNLGFTLGAYLCYTLLADATLLDAGPGGTAPTDAAAGDAALAYAIAQVNLMAVFGIVLLYPLARRLGPEGGADEPVWLLVTRSLLDVRAAMFYAALVGVALAYGGVPYPAALDRLPVVTVLFYLGGFGAYFGIGLRLHVGQSLRRVRLHVLLAGFKFVLLPLLTAGLLAAASLSGHPLPRLAQAVLMVSSTMPTAIQTVITANLFHLDARLASGLWVVNTAVFVVGVLPVLVWVLG